MKKSPVKSKEIEREQKLTLINENSNEDLENFPEILTKTQSPFICSDKTEKMKNSSEKNFKLLYTSN